ncbi:MAG: hypothetical protein H7343_15305 [Undibacterium sp.]|nr:hypothetical protein [Opitutaceae bacterium]
MTPLSRVLACAALALGLFYGASARADEPGFTAKLGAIDQSATGLAKLSAEQAAALDAQIVREIAVARQGDVVAFSRSFIQRRSADQLTAAGLSALTPEERHQLDIVVARAVAQRPAIVVRTLSAKAKAADDAVETITYKPQLHGEVTLTVGTAGGGRNFYGGSFTTVYDDPQRKFSVAFTYAEYHGKGLLPFDDCFRSGSGLGIAPVPGLR